MKQKVWINSTNYLIQEIYGFTDSVSSTAITANNTTATLPEKGKPAPNKDRHSGRLSRSMSRVSRAESIASRVTELTMERPKKKSARKRLSAVVAPNGAEAKDDTDSKDLGKRVSKSSTIDGLDISRRTSTSVRCKGNETEAGASVQGRRLSSESIFSSVTTATEQPAPTEDGRQSEDEQEDEAEKEDEKDDEGTTKASLVMLDAPECVICLSDVKDTIVLPCRHFCICSECGDILRRRAPQRCPICRQGIHRKKKSKSRKKNAFVWLLLLVVC